MSTGPLHKPSERCMQLPAPVFCRDAEGRFMGCNAAFEACTGYKSADITGKPFELLAPEDLRDFYREQDRQLFAGNDDGQFEADMISADGSARRVLFRQSLVRDDDGQVTGAIGVIIDIEDRLVAEKRVTEALKRTEDILAAVNSILIGVDDHDRITLWNDDAEKHIGGKAEDRLGELLHSIPFGWNWTRVDAALNFCREKHKPVVLRDLHYERFDGQDGVLSVRINPFLQRSQKGRGLLILAEDVTRNKLLHDQLMQAQKLESVGMLASGVAHEINTPAQYIGDNTRFLTQVFSSLAPIIEKFTILLKQAENHHVDPGLVSRLKAEIHVADLEYTMREAPVALNESLEGISRISSIVKAMKEFSHPGVNKKVAMSLKKLIESTLTVSRNEWGNVAELTTSYDPAMPKTPVLPSEFNQVILNIIINAVHAMKAAGCTTKNKGKLSIVTEWRSGWAVIRISDTGAGIPRKARSRIFDPFFTTREVGKGTGQGLAIAHSIIVEKHQGRIFFETDESTGTTFTVEIPTTETHPYDNSF